MIYHYTLHFDKSLISLGFLPSMAYRPKEFQANECVTVTDAITDVITQSL